MLISSILGTVGATLTTLSFMPQAIKVIKTRHTKDLSLIMYIMLTTGICFWLAYGIMLMQWPIIISNIISLFPTSITLIIKIKDVLNSRQSKISSR